MKTVTKDELFQNLSGFLKSKGIELKDGSYTQMVHQGCSILADTVNVTQRTVRRARKKADQAFDGLRQSIHTATAPKPPPPPKPTGKSRTATRAKSQPATPRSRRK